MNDPIPKSRDAAPKPRGPLSEKASVYLGLGSNLGRREEHLQTAIDRLHSHPDARVIRVSPIYETAAHTLGNVAKPPYLNAVAEIETALNPDAFLEVCHEVERSAGRNRHAEDRWSSRTLDLDILVFGGQTMEMEGITIPHPRMGERQFVLRPLVDLAADLWIPFPYQTSAAELLEACTDETYVKKTTLTILP